MNPYSTNGSKDERNIVFYSEIVADITIRKLKSEDMLDKWTTWIPPKFGDKLMFAVGDPWKTGKISI